MERTEQPDERERHASNLELFLDLVFVFAVTQIAGLFATDTGPAGFGRSLLLAWLVWWLWSQFTWLGTAIDLGDRSLNQFLILAAVPLALLMAVAIPHAYAETGPEFAGAFLAVNLWALAIQGRGLWNNPVTRTAWMGYAPLAAVAPCLVLLGAAFEQGPRTAIWSFVAVFEIASAIQSGRRTRAGDGTWTIDPLHFAERHALFVIISLGEVLVAVGVAASDHHLDVGRGAGVATAVSVACVLWWTYFAYVPGVLERVLRESLDRARTARNLLSFGHFPVIIGIVLYAVAAKHAVVHPGAALGTSDRSAMAISVAAFLGGLLGLQWQVARRLAPERVVAIAVIAGLCVVGVDLAGGVLLAAVGVTLACSQAITLRRFTRS